jgi:hypothetical protein
MQSPTPLLATLLLATLLTACGGAETKSTANGDSQASTEEVQDPEANSDTYDEGEGEARKSQAGSYDPFIPEGYEVLGSAEGDLNKDEYIDAVLALKMIGEADVPDPYDNPAKRPLLLLLGNADYGYSEAARNDNVVLCQACGGVFGDPYDGITIKDGYFSVEHYGGSNWRWSRIITFKWDAEKKDWFLHKDGGVNYHTSDPDKVEEEVKTVKDFGVVPFGKFNYEDGQ